MTKPINPSHRVKIQNSEANIFIANKGEGLPQHDHEYGHITYCASGSLIVKKQNVRVLITKESTPVYLIPNEWHELEAAEDGTVFINLFVNQNT